MNKPIIIFGAGASRALEGLSRDALQDYKIFPPTTNELFEMRFSNIIGNYDLIQDRVEQIRAEVQKQRSLEDFLNFLATEGDLVSKKQLIEIQLYLQELFDHISYKYIKKSHFRYNFYIPFLNELAKNYPEGAAIVNFNYDLFLDRSMKYAFDDDNNSYEYDNINSYYNKPYELYKVHGSSNWGYFWDYKRLDSPDEKVEFLMNSNPNTVKKLDLIDRTIEYDKLVTPALAIPTVTEKKFIIPEHSREKLIERFKEADKLMIIGWSANDEEFVELIRKNIDPGKIKITVISGKNAKEVLERIISENQLKNTPNLGNFTNGGDFRSVVTDIYKLKEFIAGKQ